MTNTIIVSYSELAKWDTCPRQYSYMFDLGLRPIEESAAISTGVKGHKLLQAFYTAMQNGSTKKEALKLVQDKANKIKEEEGIAGELLKSWGLVHKFIQETEFNSKVLLVENRFLFPASKLSDDPIFDNVQIGFTPDVVFERSGGFIDVEDAKFIGRAWSQSKLDRFTQAKLYEIFLENMGYKVSRSGIRFFNTTTGKISVNYDTTTERERENVIYDFMEGFREIVQYKLACEVWAERPMLRRTANYSTCQYCAFSFPCGLEAKGKDASRTLNSQYVKSTYDYSK